MKKKRASLIGAVLLVALGTFALVKYVSTAEDRALAEDLARGIKRERRAAQEGGLGAGGFGPGGNPGGRGGPPPDPNIPPREQ